MNRKRPSRWLPSEIVLACPDSKNPQVLDPATRAATTAITPLSRIVHWVCEVGVAGEGVLGADRPRVERW